MSNLKLKGNGISRSNKTFLIAPFCPNSSLAIYNKEGNLLLQKTNIDFPAHFIQLADLSGYSYFSGNLIVEPKTIQKFAANGRYVIGKLYVTDNELNVIDVVDCIPTEKISNPLGVHMHGNYVLGKNHYLLQIISFEEVIIKNKKSYVVNCGLQEQKDGVVIGEGQSIDYPELFNGSFCRNNFFHENVVNKKYAADYAHMNSVVFTKDKKYCYISFKHIGIVKIEYLSKKIVGCAGLCGNKALPYNAKMFYNQHDIQLLDDDSTLAFGDNESLSYVEMKMQNDEFISYFSFKCPSVCKKTVMGNALKTPEETLNVCYGLRLPFLIDIINQPIISEFDMRTGEKLLDILIEHPINIMYQINRGVNIYENK